jgi:hypothetical protein
MMNMKNINFPYILKVIDIAKDAKCLARRSDIMQRKPKLIKHYLYICELCLNCEGEMCHTPGCVFIRMPMESIESILNNLDII